MRAFVGHSFSEDDAALVATFLSYFDDISKMGIGFSWEHARAAQPTEISGKVMELLKGKDALIAICTKHERTIAQADLEVLMTSKKKWTSKEPHFEWKASDWVIQEIGLAKGMGLKIMLLKESGIRSPGGIQADLEYIEFDRDRPEKAFPRILQMLNSSTQRSSTGGQVASEQTAESAVATLDQVQNDYQELVPSENWEQKDYDWAVVSAKLQSNSTAVEQISAAYKSSSMFDSSSWDAWLEFAEIFTGKGGSLPTLKMLAESEPHTARKFSILARCYAMDAMHIQSARTFERAIAIESDFDKLNKLRSQAVRQYALAGERIEAERLIDDLRESNSQDNTIETVLLQTLLEFGEIMKENQIQTSAMERMLELDPHDEKTRFSLAFAYSESKRDDLAIFHYGMIREENRSSATWNNLGVSYNNFDMPVRAVSAYKQAVELGDTLASSNLAIKYLNAGFVEEANSRIQRALQAEDSHKNVASTFARIKQVEDDEGDKENELKTKLTPELVFDRRLGRALTLTAPAELSGTWKGPDCELTISSSNGTVRAEGTYQRANFGLLANALLGTTSRLDAPLPKYKVVYTGSLRGRGIMGEVERSPVSKLAAPKTVYDIEVLPDVRMIVSDDEKTINVLEKDPKGEPQFYSFTRLDLRKQV